MKIRVLIQGAGKTAAGMEIPPEVVEALGAGRKPPVRLTIGDFTYRSTIATMNGAFMVGISNDNRGGRHGGARHRARHPAARGDRGA